MDYKGETLFSGSGWKLHASEASIPVPDGQEIRLDVHFFSPRLRDFHGLALPGSPGSAMHFAKQAPLLLYAVTGLLFLEGLLALIGFNATPGGA